MINKIILVLALVLQIVSLPIIKMTDYISQGVALFSISALVVIYLSFNLRSHNSLYLFLSSIFGAVIISFDMLFIIDEIYYLLLLLVYFICIVLVLSFKIKKVKKVKITKKTNKPKITYAAVVEGKCFHKSTCLTLIRSKNKDFRTVTKEDSLAKGLKPCRFCKP
ncbi:MAG: hypothetical protein ACMXX6_00450 [Candidatus Woesearchaeota archaeon]